MKQWARKVSALAGCGITPWLAAQAQAMALTPASSSPAAAAYTGQAGAAAPEALAVLLWLPLLLLVLLSTGTLLLLIWRQRAGERRQRRAMLRAQPATQLQPASGVTLPVALALSSASILVAPPAGDWPQAAPAANSAAVQRDAADAAPVLASAENR